MTPLLTISPPQTQTTGSASVYLQQFWTDMGASALYAKWRTQNPGEYQRLKDYAAGGTRPQMLTAFGRALIDVCDVGRAVGAPYPTIP
jgi:hypothetical protein